MINIVAGYFENRNILEASKEASSIEDLNVSIANSEQELINAFKDPGVDAVVRGSLKSHEIMKFLKEYKKDNAINRATFINTLWELMKERLLMKGLRLQFRLHCF